jgi:rSAM/selenodomain-associated transferase 1
MIKPDSRELIIFARNPIAGRVKTRLIPALGIRGATALYREMLEQTLKTALRLKGVNVSLWCTETGGDCSTYTDAYDSSLYIQQGNNLGERMHQAIEQQLQTAAHALLIGTDCPGFTTEHLESAFAALQSHDAVLGPSSDGGYVLIGLNQPQHHLFSDIDWSTDKVLEQTRQRLVAHKLSFKELEELHDIDTPDDLKLYPEYHARYSEYLQTETL